MKISVFTGNQPRHLALTNKLSKISDRVFAVQECNTVFPGTVKDFYENSPVMKKYFSLVIAAEERNFGSVGFSPNNVSTLSIKSGDLSIVDVRILEEALESDLLIVFGASWIRGPLIDELVSRRALNIHMGVSPYYRGSSCNFWALYDGNPDLVGSTIHRLGRGLDSGNIYFHAMPKQEPVDPFDLGMKAVKAAHSGLVASILDGSLFESEGVTQQSELEVRYSRNAEFSEQIASEYLGRALSPEAIGQSFYGAAERALIQPRIF